MRYPTQRLVTLTLIIGIVLTAMATRVYFINDLTAAAAMSVQVHPTPSLSPNIPFIVPNANLIPNGGPILSDFDYFSWQSFIAMNWPAKIGPDGRPLRGVPDTTKTLSDPGPRVWETWKADYELFQNSKDGTATPSDWNDYEVKNAPCGQAQSHVLPLIAKGDSVIPGGVNQAMGGPLIPQQKVNNQLTYVRYEVRVNQTQYNETKNAQYYLRSKLPKFPARINFSSSKIDPVSGNGTYGAIEIKAAWRLMTPEEMNNQAIRSRYYITQATIVDPKTGQCSQTTVPVGLVGFHIGHKTSPFAAWVWSTFEQVDNVPCTRAEQQGGDMRCAAPPEGFSFNNGTNSPDATANGYFPLNAIQPFNPNKPPFRPLQVIRFNDVRDDIITMNNLVRTLPGIQGTVWEFYKLVGNQWPTQNVDPKTGQPIPIVLNDPTTDADAYPRGADSPFPQDGVANITMETYYQNQAEPPSPLFGTSCIHCHYQAAQFDFSWVTADAAWPPNPGTIKSP